MVQSGFFSEARIIKNWIYLIKYIPQKHQLITFDQKNSVVLFNYELK